MAIKDHISARKGSVTSKNFEVFLRNITQLETYLLKNYGKFEV